MTHRRALRARSAFALFPMLSVAAAGLFASAPVQARPLFQMPFPCGQVWSGSTRSNHNPLRSIDFNRTDDEGDPVVASAGGRVSLVRDLGGTSYGLYVVVDHGDGWQTLYAHLQRGSLRVSSGQSVSRGQRLASVGTSGGSSGPHLHYEQKLNGSAVSIQFNGNGVVYYDATQTLTSRNCDAANATGVVNTTSGVSLNVRAQPTTASSIVGSVADGQRVTIYCQTRGQTITGTYGTSSLWNRIGSGRYIPDVYTYTGSDGQVAPSC